MCGGGGGGSQIIPFNMDALKPFLPSVFKGPYNAQGAYQNEQMLAKKYPWITPPAGQFEGAQPGQFAGADTGSSTRPAFSFGTITDTSGGGGGVPAPTPPVPPTVPPGGGGGGAVPAQINPQQLATGQGTGMMPTQLQSIIAALSGGMPSGGQ